MILFLEPPPQYDHPYHGQVIERRLSALQIMQLCHGPTTGCASVTNGICHIALPQDEKDSRLVALMRRHEIGHCNGWPSDHAGGRRVEYDEDRHALAPKPKPGHLNVTLF
jgi:hypothetical protein